MRDSLARFVGGTPSSSEHLERMRRAAWLKQGVVMLDPREVLDPWLRQAIVNEATTRYGRRPPTPNPTTPNPTTNEESE